MPIPPTPSWPSRFCRYLNGPLRDSTFGHGKKPHPLPVTMSYLAEGIKKLRAVRIVKAKEGATKTAHLWRGMRNLDICDKFLTDGHGGTEVPQLSLSRMLQGPN